MPLKLANFCAMASRSDAMPSSAGVDVVAAADGVDGRFDDGVRRVGVADALGHVDAVGGGAGDVHGADFRLHGVGREIAEAKGRECRGCGMRKGAPERRAFYLSELRAGSCG